MFTGIVEELGQVVAVEELGDSSRITVHGPLVTSDARAGDSIAVNGVCLTVVDNDGGAFTADVMAETLRASSLRGVAAGARVNLERAVRLQDRLGGHLVLGHVDGTGEVLAVESGERWTVLRISLPEQLDRYVARKGSVAVDGVSLTVSDLGAGWFEVSLIPTTLALTTMGARRVGDVVNLEADVTAKHIERLLAAGVRPAGHATGETP